MSLKNGPEGKLPMTSWQNAVRNKCFNCSNFNWREVALCVHTDCELYELRLGKDPFRKKRELTEEQREQLTDRLKTAREAKQEQAKKQ